MKKESQKKVSLFYNNHRDWFITMTASFVATVLGILVTLGASILQQRNAHKKQSELFMHDVLLDLTFREDNMRKDSIFFAKVDSALSVLDVAIDDYAPLFMDTIVYRYMGKMAYYSPLGENHLIENLFTTNEAAFHLIDDYELTQKIRICYGVHSSYNTQRKELADVTMHLLPEIVLMVSLQVPDVEIMRKTDQMAQYYEWMQRIWNTYTLVDKMLPQIHAQRLSIMETMGATQEDIESWKNNKH